MNDKKNITIKGAAHRAILAHILRETFPMDGLNDWFFHEPITDDNVEGAYNACLDANSRDHRCWVREVLNEFRTNGTAAPGLGFDTYSRHYEGESVAGQLDDGRWVAWIYWHGGGKHSEPESIPWLENAIFVRDYDEVVTVKRFARLEE
jgi:hypothetical protein